MTHIYEILEALTPKTNHIVVMTNDSKTSREIINELRCQNLDGEGRVFFKGDSRISIVAAGDAYEGAENYSLLHWGWYNQPETQAMKKVRQWEAKATEILTK